MHKYNVIFPKSLFNQSLRKVISKEPAGNGRVHKASTLLCLYALVYEVRVDDELQYMFVVTL